jgi:hypothetical protein
MEEYRASEEDVKDFIEHHGILGQKWGIRRDKDKLDRLAGRTEKEKAKAKVDKIAAKAAVKTAKLKAKTDIAKATAAKAQAEALAKQKPKEKPEPKTIVRSEEYLKAREVTKKTIPELSSKEMQDFVTRMNLEKQYRELAFPKTPPSPVKKFLLDFGKDTAKSFSKNASNYIAKESFNRIVKALNGNEETAKAANKEREDDEKKEKKKAS